MTPTSTVPDLKCRCGSNQLFSLCCEPLLKRTRAAANAEELMRSRFTAHAIGDFEHLHRTYLPTSKKPYVAETDVPDMKWTRLVVHAHEAGPKADTAFVDFSAYYEDGGEQAIHEKSEFLRVDGSWYYSRTVRNGPAPVRSSAAKVGRNDPCPCGSGRKYKHCHGA